MYGLPAQQLVSCGCRGAYRASAGKWFHPETFTPPGTKPDPHNSRAKLSKLKDAGPNLSLSCWSFELLSCTLSIT